MKYFKEIKEVESVTGWAKFYYDFADLDRYDSPMLLNYLIDTEPVAKHCPEEGYEDYLRYADEFISAKLNGATSYVIKAMFDDLVKHDYIYYHNLSNNPKKYRYIKLNYEKLKRMLGATPSENRSEDPSESVPNTLHNGLRRY